MTFRILILCTIGVVAAALVLFFFLGWENEEFQLVPRDITKKATEETETAGAEVGTGWTISEDPGKAVREAVDMALRGKTQKSPDFAIIYASADSDMMAILDAAKQILGKNTKIFGGTSDSRAVMTDKGFVKVTKRGYAQATMEGPKSLAVIVSPTTWATSRTS